MIARPRSRSRRGATVAIALTMLAVTGLLIGAMLRRSVSEQRQMRVTWQEWQVQWLARAAVERARQRSGNDSSYTEEVWKPELPGAAPEVEIRISKAAGDDGEDASVSVVAVCPSIDSPLRVRFTHTAPLHAKRLAASR